MYELAVERLARAGYEHYEISNWALAGKACAHNLTYWHNLPYIGLGAGAHSWYVGHRFVEARSLRDYTSRVATAVEDSAPPNEPPPYDVRKQTRERDLPAAAVVEDETISRELEMAETAMMGLRLASGLPLATFATRYGQTFASVFGGRLADVVALRLLEVTDTVARLTPRGMLLGNEVFERLLPDTP
jgi:oxygen-independent coproporphyrinogen-3 oxidase